MNLQQYRFKFLTIAKNFAIGILVIGLIISIRTILDFNKAQRIQSMNGPEFRQLLDGYNFKRASLRSLQSVAKKALDVSPQEIDASQQATAHILAKKSNCLDCQNRIVFFDLNKNDTLTKAGLDALQASYDLSPYGDIELMKWRLEISSSFWTELNDDLQKSALTQITALSQFQKGRFWLRSFDTNIDSIKSRVSRITN